MTALRRLAHAARAPLVPAVLLFRMGKRPWIRNRHFAQVVRAMTYIVAFLASWSAGEMAGYLAPQRLRG